jgi:rRNA-processing protein FCF1
MTIPGNELRPLIEQVVTETLDRLEAERVRLSSRIAYTEGEAASLIGVARHVLRDARLRHEIEASRVGKRIVYTRDELLRFLQRQKT